MDFVGLLEYLNSIGFPVPLCIILGVIIVACWHMHKRLSMLENKQLLLVKKEVLKQYLRRDIFALEIKAISTENRLGDSLNTIRIEQLDDRTSLLETQVNKIQNALMKINGWIRGRKSI